MEKGEIKTSTDPAINGGSESEKDLLKKIYQSVKQETPIPIQTEIIGTIPSWLKGNLLRNGPGQFEVGEESVDHLFDGLSFLHRFIIEGGEVKYQGRFLRSDIYEKAMKHQRLVFSGFGTPARHPDPCKTLFQRIFSIFEMEFPDNCNPLTRDSVAQERSMSDKLDVLDTVDIEKLVGVHTATAHPHCGRDGTTYNLGTTFSMRCKYCVIQVPPISKKNAGENAMSGASILSSIPASSYNPTYYHSFGISENYIIFVEQPLHINLFKVMLFSKLLGTRPMTECMEYHPDSKVRFHLIRRDDGTVISTHYTADAFFCFHHCNAYETDDGKDVVVDMCCFEDDDVLKRSTMDNIRKGNLHVEDCVVRRYVLPLGAETKEGGDNLVTMVDSEATATLSPDGSIHCIPEQLCDVSLELPQVNYADFNGRDYQYLYVRVGNMQKNKICFCFLCIGVILSCVTNLADDKQPPFLLVLDARTLTEIARAVIPLPISLFGIHGIFV
eukprot:XP_011682688.1 PREDICTED: retinal Mueller cells isomerohydrolase [Strongylocentrotus purpuratus]